MLQFALSLRGLSDMPWFAETEPRAVFRGSHTYKFQEGTCSMNKKLFAVSVLVAGMGMSSMAMANPVCEAQKAAAPDLVVPAIAIPPSKRSIPQSRRMPAAKRLPTF